LDHSEKKIVFDHFFCRLASFRNTAVLHAELEYTCAHAQKSVKADVRNKQTGEINSWAQSLLQNAWDACNEQAGSCPKLTSDADTSIESLPPLPPPNRTAKILNIALLIHVTTTKQYSGRTRAFFSAFCQVDESLIVALLQDPDTALKQAQKSADEAKNQHGSRRRTLRMIGIGLAGVTGGVLVGVTGGLAAPLVGAGLATVFGWLGIGGTAAGLLATGLASSSVVCGALFGAYGARSMANQVARHTRQISDLAIVPVGGPVEDESMAVRLCVSGWLQSPEDVTAPWTVFEGDHVNTFALQWEIAALEELSSALYTLVKSNLMKYIRTEVFRRTLFASLITSLSPIAFLKIGEIIDNPWMNARALAIKTGAILGDLLAQRVFGNRPVTLSGFSLGALVVVEALRYLTALPPAETCHLVQDVFVFGAPVPCDAEMWPALRRVVAGRLVNGYSSDDYVLATLSRASSASWNVAGLRTVDAVGIENVECEVGGHTRWREMVGRALQQCGAPGISSHEAEL
ncbi:DUF726-domain-containing protein, partial [Fistulina hepatica ATCC 64428]